MSEIYGLIGKNLSYSFSPQIHDIIFEITKKEGSYDLFEYPDEESAHIIDDLFRLGASGVNVTIPYKETIIRQLDEISRQAREIGAVNTVVFRNSRAIGHNTDYYGVEKAFEILGFDPRGKRAVILGAGGAARAVVAVLENSGISEISLISRNAKSRAFTLSTYSYADLANFDDRDIIINCTPVGTFPNIDQSVVDENILKKFIFAFDLTYNPSETKFMKIARAQGLKTVGGLAMLVYQAIKAQEIWSGMAMSQEESDLILSRVKALLS